MKIFDHSVSYYKPRIQTAESPTVLQDTLHSTQAGSRDFCLRMRRLFSFAFPSSPGHGTAVFQTFEKFLLLIDPVKFLHT
jgi:hypothetical protein